MTVRANTRASEIQDAIDRAEARFHEERERLREQFRAETKKAWREFTAAKRALLRKEAP